MARTYSTEAQQEQLDRLIAARITAVDEDIFAGRKAVVSGVAALADLNADEEEAEALVRAAVVGHSALVGSRIAGAVQLAIYEYALPLAEADLADAERSRAVSRAEDRAAMVFIDRVFA